MVTFEPTRLSEKNIQEIKKILEETHRREFTYDEAKDAALRYATIVDLALKAGRERYRRKKMLEASPKGYHLDCAGACEICGHTTSGENSWFDRYGLKCITCQRAVNAKIVPASITGNDKSWYSPFDLESYFNINKKELRKYVKQSFLIDRIIPDEKGKVHLQLFLIKDNKAVLPPKKLLKSKIIRVKWKGEEYYTVESWYNIISQKDFQRLKKYGIMDCLPETFSKPISMGQFYFKEINPLMIPYVAPATE